MICCYIHSRFCKRMKTMNQIHLKVCFVNYELVSRQTACGGGSLAGNLVGIDSIRYYISNYNDPAHFDYIAAKLAECITDENEKLWLPPIRQDECEATIHTFQHKETSGEVCQLKSEVATVVKW
uniref:Uncharacterized protein n=1 Tax=Helianthus annuus TaxID=4232 RepID=A0A251UC92_HELAN